MKYLLFWILFFLAATCMAQSLAAVRGQDQSVHLFWDMPCDSCQTILFKHTMDGWKKSTWGLRHNDRIRIPKAEGMVYYTIAQYRDDIPIPVHSSNIKGLYVEPPDLPFTQTGRIIYLKGKTEVTIFHPDRERDQQYWENPVKIDLSDWRPGTYFINIERNLYLLNLRP